MGIWNPTDKDTWTGEALSNTLQDCQGFCLPCFVQHQWFYPQSLRHNSTLHSWATSPHSDLACSPDR